MGMFDSVYLEIECPYCKKASLIECQTKDTPCVLDVWHKGDDIGTDQFKYLYCIGDCQSKECVDWTDKRHGYHSGFGRLFDLKVLLDKGIITGEYEIIKDNSEKPLEKPPET